ncbi:MAG TPA: hypothetical protein VK843_18800 [Planctomycetota bacterium]|nr:hypothetical protein [Planctomycetota bacterium]
MTLDSVDGRRCIGQRELSWAGLEDKTIIESVCEGLEIPHLLARVVDVADLDGAEIEASLRSERGTVWSGDSSEGLNGGGSHVRWVSTELQRAEAREFFRLHCKRVRIAPFVEGLSVSIHGIIAGGAVAVFRPVEQIVARNSISGRFDYLGTSTFWIPPKRVYTSMRDAGRLIGTWLRDVWGVRGTFNVDGLATKGSFWPTEVNVRYSDGMWTIARSAGEIPLHLFDVVIRARGCSTRLPEELERDVIRDVERDPQVAVWITIDHLKIQSPEVFLLLDDHGCHVVSANGPCNAKITFTASGGLAYGEVTFAAGVLASGDLVGDVVRSILRTLDHEWHLGYEGLEVGGIEMFHMQ